MNIVLLLGASGMLGSSLAPKLSAAGHKVIRQSRKYGYDLKLDLLSHQAWIDCLSSLRPDTIVNLAAAANVDQCELDPQWAFDGNISPLLALERASCLTNIRPHLVHISTDQVYNGSGPHSEDQVKPCNVYALSKLGAELAIKALPATILRTNFFGLSYSRGKPSFSDWIIHSIRSERQITLFKDVLFSAIHMDTLCSYINLAIETRTPGTFNVGSRDGISKAEFGLHLASLLGLSAKCIRVGSVDELSLKARRPFDMRMETFQFQDKFGVRTPIISDEINKAANEYYA
jgi:dTDP-4-dehydrorhamnose reductase